MFGKVLVANRGEIAVRVLRTCKRLGVRTVAVYSDADARALHVRLADEAVRLGPPPVRDSYLSFEAVLGALEQTKADAVHPGYGLLSENAIFAARVAEAGAVFIGPPPGALEMFGDKIRARRAARAAGIEPPLGSEDALDIEDMTELARLADRVGYPLLIKAAAGGGGIGMQVVNTPEELPRAARTCADRGRAAFGDARVYLERYLSRPRHIELQALSDAQGVTTILGERECSVQRRHQKILEESPSAAGFLSGEAGAEKRRELAEAARRLLGAAGYVGAGTIEFVADGAGHFHFLEVNARLQVEHPVTEMVTGLDLVELQLRVASGDALPKEARDVRLRGHAIESRLYAEDPQKGFIPQPGTLERLEWPEPEEGLRIDTGVETGDEVTPFYDPLIAKIIAHGADRQTAIERLRTALGRARVTLVGPKGARATNLAFLMRVLADARFVSGTYDTGLAGQLAVER